MHEPFIYKLVPVVADCLGEAFPEIKARADYVSTVIESEEASFGRTLDRGIEIFAAAARRAQKSKDKIISGEDAFQLYDTYGFPLDLTELMARERNLKVDTATFAQLMEAQRTRARAAQKSSLMTVNPGIMLPVTDDTAKYQTSICKTKVKGWIRSGAFTKTGTIDLIEDGPYNARDETIGLILEKTCFYAEAGGQVGDCGMIESESGRFVVETTQKVGDCIIHWGKLATGGFSTAQAVTATVDEDRTATKKNHTATHLLQWALQQVLGGSVAQQGSLVCPDYLRFDFTYPKAVTEPEKKKVEQLVREKIAADLPVTCCVMPKEQAQKLGAMALFGEKYGNEVRVVSLGAEGESQIGQAFSREFCGGTHVDRLGSIGGFKIIKEESISAGVRRITALTGQGLTAYLEKASDIVDELSAVLKVPSEALVDRVGQLIEDNKKLSKQLRSAARHSSSDTMAEAKQLLEKCEKLGETSLIVGRLSTTPVEQAREAIDMLKKKAKSAAIVLGFVDDGKAALLAGMTNDLVKKGVKAGDIVKQIAPIVDGGGGGKPQMAQAGGKNPDRIDDALTRAAEIIKELLAGG
jgi:alanyl-tRNA synthetase